MFQIMVLSTCVALHVSKVPYKTKAPYQSLGGRRSSASLPSFMGRKAEMQRG